MFAPRRDLVVSMTAPGSWEKIDRAHVWHPYSPAGQPALHKVVAADGNRLTLESPDGSRAEVIDAMSSWWCMIHGYNHPKLNAALHEQVDQFSHVMFGGLTHDPALRLAQTLVDMTPPGLEHVFLADSGSVAVEVALKTVFQAAAGAGRTSAHQVIAVAGGYHGDTLGDMAVCDPDNGMHASFAGVMPTHIFAPRPPLANNRNSDDCIVDLHDDAQAKAVDEWAQSMSRLVEEHRDQVAAIIVEPILQGAGGMRPYPARCLRVLRDLCDEHGLFLVVDEIATGFGRTDSLFAVNHADVVPDVMCVGKSMTGGYMTQAAMITTQKVSRLVNQSPAGALLHGPTFMANPLACTVSQASLELLNDNTWQTQVPLLEKRLASALSPLTGHTGISRVNVVGAVGVVELDKPAEMVRATNTALQHGVWIRPYGRLLYTMPPFISTNQDVDAIGTALVETALHEIKCASGTLP